MATTGAQRATAARDNAPVEWDEVPASVRAAVDRALNRHQKDALTEVEQILDAALRVATRVAPSEPKVSDIVAEAGTSNQTFYRYFAGKNELLHAVMERGVVRARSYLGHQMDKRADPAGQVAAWVEGMLAQLTRPDVARQSIAVGRLTSASGMEAAQNSLDEQLGQLLVAPLTAAGRPRPDLDAQVIQDAVLGALNRHVTAGTMPDDAERRHLVDFVVAVVQPTAAP